MGKSQNITTASLASKVTPSTTKFLNAPRFAQPQMSMKAADNKYMGRSGEISMSLKSNATLFKNNGPSAGQFNGGATSMKNFGAMPSARLSAPKTAKNSVSRTKVVMMAASDNAANDFTVTGG